MAKFHPLDYSQYQHLFKIGYLLVGANDSVLTANQEARLYLEGFKPCSLDDCTLYDVLPELFDGRQNLPKLTRTQQKSFSLSRIWRRGTNDEEYYLDIYIEPYPKADNQLVIILQDVSKQARQDQQLQEQHDELKLMYAAIETQKEQLQDEIAQRQKAEIRQKKLAMTDHLTGIYNRRYFFDLYEKEISRSRRYERPIAVIIFDLDHFKRINDTYGYLAGDKALKSVVTRCLKNLRHEDVLARYGGEEFVLMLPETNAENAMLIAERLRALIANRPFKFNKRKIPITISLGVASIDKVVRGLTADYLLSTADEALRQAKHAGRNQACIGK